jgi:hypothetical protein
MTPQDGDRLDNLFDRHSGCAFGLEWQIATSKKVEKRGPGGPRKGWRRRPFVVAAFVAAVIGRQDDKAAVYWEWSVVARMARPDGGYTEGAEVQDSVSVDREQ